MFENIRKFEEESVDVSKLSNYYDSYLEMLHKAEEVYAELHDKKLDYMVQSLIKLTELMKDCDQFDFSLEEGQNFKRVNKVCRIYRYIQSYELDYNKVNDRVVCGGLFVKVPVYIIRRDLFKKASKNKYGIVTKAEEFGIPNNDEANYAARKFINNDTMLVVVKDDEQYITKYIRSARDFDFVYLKGDSYAN